MTDSAKIPDTLAAYHEASCNLSDNVNHAVKCIEFIMNELLGMSHTMRRVNMDRMADRINDHVSDLEGLYKGLSNAMNRYTHANYIEAQAASFRTFNGIISILAEKEDGKEASTDPTDR